MHNYIDFKRLRELMENIDIDKCKNYTILNTSLRADEFFEINPNSIYEKLHLGIKLYLLDEFDYIFSVFSDNINRESKGSTELLDNLKKIDDTVNQATKTIFMKIKNQPFQQVRNLMYNIDTDKCEEHAIKHGKRECTEGFISIVKKEKIVKENYLSEDGVYDYLVVNFFKKIRKIHTQNLPFLTELEDENILMEQLFEILVEASKTITKALKTSFF